MTKICKFCNETLVWPEIFNCFYCQNTFCDKHSQAENHECPKAVAAKHIEKDYLRRRGVNITSGRYKVVCKSCGFETDFHAIEDANQLRIEHIHENNCESKLVRLLQHEDDRKDDSDFVRGS